MAQCTTNSLLKYFSIHSGYNSVEEDLEKYYFMFNLTDQDIEEKAIIIEKILPNLEIKSRGDLCAFTKPKTELKDLSEKLFSINDAVTLPSFRSIVHDNDVLYKYLKFAEKYGFPLVYNESSKVLDDVFNFQNDYSNYLRGLNIEETLYTAEENKKDSKFRKLPDLSIYQYFCAKLQSLSMFCFNKVLKLNEDFDDFVIDELSKENAEENVDEIMSKSLVYLKNDNPFIEIENMIQTIYPDNLNEEDRGIRR